MAKIVLGMATSHGPLLSTPPEQWGERAKADRANPALWFRGKPYKYDALEQLRVAEKLDQKWELSEREKRYARCRKALDTLAATFEKANPDLVVIVGNDQQEVFCDKNMPAFSIYFGESVTNRPPSPEQIAKMPPGSSLRSLLAKASIRITTAFIVAVQAARSAPNPNRISARPVIPSSSPTCLLRSAPGTRCHQSPSSTPRTCRPPSNS